MEEGGGVVRVVKRVIRSVWAWGESVLNPPFLPRGAWDDMVVVGLSKQGVCVLAKSGIAPKPF